MFVNPVHKAARTRVLTHPAGPNPDHDGVSIMTKADMDSSTTRPLSRRRLLSKTATIAGFGGTISSVAGAGVPTADDARLSDLCRRWQEIMTIISRLNDEAVVLHKRLPSRQWTPEELTAHRIDGKKDEPRYISPDDIEKNDRWDRPRKGEFEWTESTSEDGAVYTQIHTVRRIKATEEDLAAWRRCAARRALYDAKEASYKEVRRVIGLDAADECIDATWNERDRLAEEIKAYRPLTVAGVLEKMRVFREDDHESFDGEPDELNWSATLFLAALADLKRLVEAGQGV